jgi:hypothetical protein
MHIMKHGVADTGTSLSKLGTGIAPVSMVFSSYWHIRRTYDAFIIKVYSISSL